MRKPLVIDGPVVAGQDGYLKTTDGTVVAVVHGFSGQAPDGQVFVPAADLTVAMPGAAAPPDYAGALGTTDHLMARAAEDLAVWMLTAGNMPREALAGDVWANINARRLLRGQKPV